MTRLPPAKTIGDTNSSPLLDEAKDSGWSKEGVDSLAENQLGRLMIDDTRSYYVSYILWTNLVNKLRSQTKFLSHRLLTRAPQIEGLRDMLHEPVSKDEDYPLTFPIA